MTKIMYRRVQYFFVVITVWVLFFSLYAQFALRLEPCPLCLMQRICVFILLGLMGLTLGTLKRARIISLLQCFVACAGLFFALRQLWLQSLPPEAAPSCMPGLDILIRYFPWQDVARALFWGSGDCAEATWSFLNISMAGWAAVYFFLMAMAGLFLYYRTQKPD
jgi:protein dithiol:quinone oxidoreductase